MRRSPLRLALRARLRDDRRIEALHPAIRQHQPTQTPTRGGATSSVHAGASADVHDETSPLRSRCSSSKRGHSRTAQHFTSTNRPRSPDLGSPAHRAGRLCALLLTAEIMQPSRRWGSSRGRKRSSATPPTPGRSVRRRRRRSICAQQSVRRTNAIVQAPAGTHACGRNQRGPLWPWVVVLRAEAARALMRYLCLRDLDTIVRACGVDARGR
jgi:hypothetical protein